MSSEIIFFIIVVFLCLDFVLERVLESLNSKHMSPVLPDSLKGIYEEKEYSRFQSYKRENGRLDSWSSGVGFVVMIVFLVAGGFGWYNSWVVSLTDSVVWQTILFVVGLSVVSSVLDIPFDYYATFRIEEKYGFNKTTRRVYWLDTVKELFLSLVLGGVLLALVVWFYTWAGTYFWLYAWGAVTLFSVFMAMFYSQLIVPLFNKQTPLQEGSLRDKIQAFAGKVGFKLDNIYVIDGSKRSTKANAYFTGLGPKKRVVLYDKKRHTLRSMVVSVIQMGVLFWLFSLCVNNVALSEALGGDRVYFQLGLIAFAILYSPVNLILGIGMNVWSRSNEYEADAFAARYYEGDYLVSGLKKISVKSLSNLTPHPLYEYVYCSHPSLLKRIDAIKRIHE